MSHLFDNIVQICATHFAVAPQVSSFLRERRKCGSAKVVGPFLAARDLRGNGVSGSSLTGIRTKEVLCQD